MDILDFENTCQEIDNYLCLAKELMDDVENEIKSWFQDRDFISDVSVMAFNNECYVRIATQEGNELYWGNLQAIVDYMMDNDKDYLEVEDLLNM